MSPHNSTSASGKFELGRVMVTKQIANRIEDDPEFETFVMNCIKRHSTGDWGDLCAEDKRENEFALDKHLRIFSAYKSGLDKIWIITEADRSTTTILFPDEY